MKNYIGYVRVSTKAQLEGYLHPPHFEGDGYYLTDNPQFNEEEWLEAEDIESILDNFVGKKVKVTIEVIE